jgi:hypothetical protein
MDQPQCNLFLLFRWEELGIEFQRWEKKPAIRERICQSEAKGDAQNDDAIIYADDMICYLVGVMLTLLASIMPGM